MGLVADQRAAIATTLNAVTDVGVVIDHTPLPRGDWQKFVETFKSTVGGTSHIRTWWIAYLGESRSRVLRPTMGGNQKIDRVTRWMVRGFLSWNDPTTDEVFADLVESVTTALDENRSLGGTAGDHDPCQVDLPEKANGVTLGDIVCHYAEITLTAKREETIAQA